MEVETVQTEDDIHTETTLTTDKNYFKSLKKARINSKELASVTTRKEAEREKGGKNK